MIIAENKKSNNYSAVYYFLSLFFPLSAGAQYRNPILYADVPDDVSMSRRRLLLHGFRLLCT